MSRPVDYRPLLRLMLEIQLRGEAILEGIAALKYVAALNQDDAPTREAVSQAVVELLHLGYQMTRHLESNAEGKPVAEMPEPVVLPVLPWGPQLDALIFRGAMQHIADLSRFVGNVERCSTPESRRKTAELLRDFGLILAAQMNEHLQPDPETAYTAQ